MKKLLLFLLLLPFLSSNCKKDEFDLNHPDVAMFVKQIKNGTYNCYEKGEDGANLWMLMPKFTESHIQSLINFAKDTTHIAEFPTNPNSSRSPFPNNRSYFILGECLLWIVEGIRNGDEFPSLDPYLVNINTAPNYDGLDAPTVLLIQDKYETWWNTYKNSNWKEKNPLEGTTYMWR